MSDKQLLFFHSPRCPGCKTIEALLNELHLSYVSIDTTLDPRAASSYGVSSTPTVIALGEEIHTFIGASQTVVDRIREFAKC